MHRDTAAGVLRTKRALLLSPVQASVAELTHRALAPDELQKTLAALG